MAKGISDLANGNGYIYATAPDGTTIKTVYNNTVIGARSARLAGAANAPVGASRSAIATITITGCAGTGNITAITIDGHNQLSGSLAVVTSTNSVLASAVAAAMNSYTPSAGYDYMASAQGDVVYVIAPIEAASSVNGFAITFSASVGSITADTTAFVNGSELSGEYDGSIGYRFFLDADYGAAGISGSAAATTDDLSYATEITRFLTVRGMETGVDVQTKTLSSNKVTNFTRLGSVTLLNIDTEGAGATDDCVAIDPTSFVEGDIVIVRSVDAARVVTVKHYASTGDNIYLNASTDMSLAGNTSSMILYYSNDPTNGASFYEISRTGFSNLTPSLTNLRTNGVNLPLSGVQTVTLATGGGTTSLTPASSKQYVLLSGSGTLSSSHTIQGAGTPKDGDEFFIKYNATFTASGNSVTIFGESLSTYEIANGGILIHAIYNLATTSWIATKIIPYAQTTVDKYENIVIPVSFESGEQTSYSVFLDYKYEITRIKAIVTKALAGTDDGTITASIDGTGVTTGVITLLASSVITTTASVTPSALYTASSVPNILSLATAKTTAGGKALVTVTLKRKS